MQSNRHETQLQPSEIPNASKPAGREASVRNLEVVKGGRAGGAQDNLALAAERRSSIELRIKDLENKFNTTPESERSTSDSTMLDILNRQLPHIRVIEENLSVIRSLEGNIDSVLNSMQQIISPGTKTRMNFEELQAAWIEQLSTNTNTLTPETIVSLIDELDKLTILYNQYESQLSERVRTHVQEQARLAELEKSLDEINAVREQIAADIASGITVKKQGGGLIAKSNSSAFKKIGTQLNEYNNAFNEAQTRLAKELLEIEDEIKNLQTQTRGQAGVIGWLKSLRKGGTPETANARDRLAAARGKEKELQIQIDRLFLIGRALGFSTGHIGATAAGIENIGEHMQFTAGAGMVGFKPIEAPQRAVTSAEHVRTAVGTGAPAVPPVFEFEKLAREILARAQKQQQQESASSPGGETQQSEVGTTPSAPDKKPKVITESEAALLRSLQNKKTPKPTKETPPISPDSHSRAVENAPEIPAEEIQAEAEIPPAPTGAFVIPEGMLFGDRKRAPNTLQEQGKMAELRRQTPHEKAVHLMDYILANSYLPSDTTPDAAKNRFEEKIKTFITLIISPEEIDAVKQALENEFKEATQDEPQHSSYIRLLKQRFNKVKQALEAHKNPSALTVTHEKTAEDLPPAALRRGTADQKPTRPKTLWNKLKRPLAYMLGAAAIGTATGEQIKSKTAPEAQKTAQKSTTQRAATSGGGGFSGEVPTPIESPAISPQVASVDFGKTKPIKPKIEEKPPTKAKAPKLTKTSPPPISSKPIGGQGIQGREEARVSLEGIGMPETLLKGAITRARTAQTKMEKAQKGSTTERTNLLLMYHNAKEAFKRARELNDRQTIQSARDMLEQAINLGVGSYKDAGL